MDIFVYDKNFNCVGVLDNYESFIWTERYDECGEFQLKTIPSVDILNLLQQDFYLMLKDSEYAMVIETLEINYDSTDGDKLTVSGRSLESILDRRIVWKQTNLDGSVQAGIKTLLDESIIEPTDENRKVSNFLFKETEDTIVVSLDSLEAQFTGDSVYDAVSNICKAYNIGFKMTLNDGNIEFELYSGVDRSYSQIENPYVVFAPSFDDIVSSDYLQSSKSYKNVTLVAGEGEGTDIKTYEVSKNDGTYSGLARREMYSDASNISSTTGSDTKLSDIEYETLLEERGREELADNKATITFDGQTDPRGLFKYGTDFKMGDIVQIANSYGWESRLRITEFIRSQGSDGYTEYPTFTQVDEDGNVVN